MFLLLPASLFLNFFFSVVTDFQTFKITGYAQGTSYQINYYHRTELIKKPEIEELLRRLDSSLSIYKSYSLISKFNSSPTGIKADKHLAVVVKKSLKIYKETQGAFDITVQPLVQVWGFGPEKPPSIPDSGTIKNILTCVGSDKISLKSGFLQKKKECVGIDVNGIAQGYSVDVIAGYLHRKGIKNFLVEIGGEIAVQGKKPSGEFMTIGIEGPGEEANNTIQTKIKIEKGAVTTSGNYRKFYQSGGKKISHLINPKTGYSLQNEMISVTVYAKNAITADGYDNALMGMGIEKSFEFLERHKKLEAYFIYKKPDGTVADTASSGFYKLFK